MILGWVGSVRECHNPGQSEYSQSRSSRRGPLSVRVQRDPDDQSGFHVCDACGRAKLAKLGQLSASHKTPYKVLAPNKLFAKVLNKCEGDIKGPVFLGHRFVTDLAILRSQKMPPLCQAPRAMVAEYCALQDALGWSARNSVVRESRSPRLSGF
jgi:hypothetical protein